MNCSIPKDIINVNLSYTRPSFFEQDCDRNFKKGNTDWTLILTPYKNGTINLDSGFTLSLLDMETNELYKIEEEYYIYENGIITIEGNSIFVQKAGQFSIQVECDGNVSYSANYIVEDGISNVDFKPLPPVGGEFTGEDVPLDEDRPQSVTSKIDEMQAQIDGFESVDPSEYRKSVDQDVIDNSLNERITTLENKPEIDLTPYRTAIEEDEINQQLFDIVPLMESGELRVVTDFNDFSQWTKTVEYVTYTTDTNSKPARDLGVVRVQKHIDYDDLDNEMVVLTLDARTTGNDVLFRRISENGTNLGAWRGVATSADLKEYTFDKEYIELNDRWNKDVADTFHKSEIGDVLWEWDMSTYSVGPVTEDMLPEHEFSEGLDRTEIVNDGVENAFRVMYPQGVYNASSSGCQIEYHFEGGDHYVCEYDLLFEDGFSFGGNAQGGKLPGLTNTERCQPEFYNNGTNGWSARPMWRADKLDSDTEFDWVPHGQTTIVGYLYQKREGSEYGTLYGDDIQPNRKSEASLLTPGNWYHITQEVKMNTTPNAYDGYVRYWLDGELLMSKYGISWSEDLTKNIDTFFFSTFHGGDSIDFAPENDSYAQFKNIKVSTVKQQTEEEDPIFNAWLATFDMGQFINKEATLLDDFKNLDLESGYYYTDDATLNDTSGGNISNAELIVSPSLRTWIGIDKWNGVYIRSYIIETGTWNPWRQLLSTKDIASLEAQVAQNTSDIAELQSKYYEEESATVYSITSASGQVEIANIVGYVDGFYRIYFSCTGERTYTAQQTITFVLMDGTNEIYRTDVSTGGPKIGPMNWVSPKRYNLNGSDLKVLVEFDGTAGLLLKDVTWSIES